jgi:hypothetical protein
VTHPVSKSMNYPQISTADLEKITCVDGAHVNFCLAWEFTRVSVWVLSGDKGNPQIRKNLFLRGRQKTTDNESQGLDG